MPDDRVQCPVVGQAEVQLVSDDVNAFRVLQDVGSDFLLDFIHYCPRKQRGTVIHRLRLHRDTLQSVRDRLANDLIEISSTDISVVSSSPALVVN